MSKPTSADAATVPAADRSRGLLRTRLELFTVGAHGIWAIAYLDAARRGLIDPDHARVMMTANVVGMLLYFPVHWQRHRGFSAERDRWGVMAEIAWGSAVCVLGFALAPSLRSPLLQALCLTQMFGFLSLRSKELMGVGAGAVLLLMATTGLGLAGRLPNFDPRGDVLSATLTVVTMTMLTAITSHYSRKREAFTRRGIELDAAVASVRALAMHDALTGLFNRRHMEERLQAEHQRSDGLGRPYTIALIDLDHFKRINDGHGHTVGDAVLRGFGELASAEIRRTDTLARWGGEEFLVLMPFVDADGSPERPLERLRDALHRLGGDTLLGRLGVRFSAGLATQFPGHGIEQTLARADAALYVAKSAGRDRAVVAPAPGGDRPLCVAAAEPAAARS